MANVQTVHTADLGVAARKVIRALLAEVFEEEVTEDDWEHCLGGVHALVWEGTEPGAELVGHASVVQRRLLYDGRALRAGYVEGVAVRADRRRRGYAAAMMEKLERVVRDAYDLGALGASDDGARLYAARGWQRWRGPTSALTPTGVVRTPEDDDCVFVLPVATRLDLTRELTCDWRDGEVW
ncbi:GNAT family N-acetyltransferase [Actinopolymorpha pittospori]